MCYLLFELNGVRNNVWQLSINLFKPSKTLNLNKTNPLMLFIYIFTSSTEISNEIIP